jgi:hypothetical protein
VIEKSIALFRCLRPRPVYELKRRSRTVTCTEAVLVNHGAKSSFTVPGTRYSWHTYTFTHIIPYTEYNVRVFNLTVITGRYGSNAIAYNKYNPINRIDRVRFTLATFISYVVLRAAFSRQYILSITSTFIFYDITVIVNSIYYQINQQKK